MFDRRLRILSLLILLPTLSTAHTPSESFSSWVWSDDTLTVRFTVSAREATRIGVPAGLANVLVRYVSAAVFPDEGSCRQAGQGAALAAQPGWMQVELRWSCDRPPGAVVVNAFSDIAAEHTHYASWKAGERSDHRVLSAGDTRWELVAAQRDQNRPADLTPYLLDGAWHVTAGVDHLAFLLALVLVFGVGRGIVLAVTGFTIGHTLALGSVALAAVEVQPVVVESLIGLTVCLVSIDYLRDRDQRPMTHLIAFGVLVGTFALLRLFVHASLSWSGLVGICLASLAYFAMADFEGRRGPQRYLVTILFGLLHGLGFATGFTAADVPAGILLPAVLAFNVGVELGQLLFIVVAVVFVRASSRAFRWPVQDALAAMLFGVGTYWFFARGLMPY